MDPLLEELVNRQPLAADKRNYPIVSVYFDPKVLARLDEVCALIGPRSRSKVINMCITRMLPTIKQQLAKGHMKPTRDRRRMDRLGYPPNQPAA